MTQAESIRQHVQQHYIEPARRRGQTMVTVIAGNVHKELGLRNRVPSVCQAMESRLLERQAQVKVSSKRTPPSGRGTTFTITYAVESAPPEPAIEPQEKPMSEAERASREEGIRLFYEMRGSAKEAFAAEGGGEAWLKKERASFYGPFKRKKML